MRQRTGCDEYITQRCLSCKYHFRKTIRFASIVLGAKLISGTKQGKFAELRERYCLFSDVTIDYRCPLIEGDGE